MKQDADKFTGDMFEQAHQAHRISTSDKPMYEVSLTTTDGIVLVWTHLTRAQAMALHKLNDTKINVLRSSTEIKQFGWREML